MKTIGQMLAEAKISKCPECGGERISGNSTIICPKCGAEEEWGEEEVKEATEQRHSATKYRVQTGFERNTPSKEQLYTKMIKAGIPSHHAKAMAAHSDAAWNDKAGQSELGHGKGGYFFKTTHGPLTVHSEGDPDNGITRYLVHRSTGDVSEATIPSSMLDRYKKMVAEYADSIHDKHPEFSKQKKFKIASATAKKVLGIHEEFEQLDEISTLAKLDDERHLAKIRRDREKRRQPNPGTIRVADLFPQQLKSYTIGCPECGHADEYKLDKKPTECPACGHGDIDTQLNEECQARNWENNQVDESTKRVEETNPLNEAINHVYLNPLKGDHEPKKVATINGRVTIAHLEDLAKKHNASTEDFEWGDKKWANQFVEQLDEITKNDLQKLASSISSEERDRIAAVIANYRNEKPDLRSTQRLIQKLLKNKYKKLEEAMTYDHTEPATEDLDCEHPECVGKDVPSTQEHFFKGPDGKLHQIGTCDKHGLDAEGMATKPAQALSGYNAQAANVIAKKSKGNLMTNSYKPETSSLMDSYVQAIDADADFKTVKEEAEQIDEGKYGPPKVITPGTTKKAARKGYDRPDSENITRAVEAIRQHNVKSFLKDLPKNAPTSKQIEYAKAANPPGFPKVRMGNNVSITIGAHGDKDEAQRRAEAHRDNLISKHGFETQTFVKQGPNGFNYGVIPLVSKAPEDDAGKKTAKKAKKTVEESLFTEEELERIADKLFVDLDEAEQLEEAKASYCGRCGTTHVKPSMGGKCPAVKEEFEQLDELTSKEKDLAAKAGNPNKITQADTLAARLKSGIKNNKDPKKVKDMLALLKKLK